MNALRHALHPVATELAGNARLRWGVWLALALSLLYCILVQSDRLAAVQRDYAAESERLAKAEALLGRQDWPERLEAERETRRRLEIAFWEAETEGLAQAKLQTALTGAIEGLDLHRLQLRSEASGPAPGLPGIWRVKTRLDAVYRPGIELRLLHALATHPKKLIVDRLDLVRRPRHDSHLVLILSAYFVGIRGEAG